MNGNHSPNQSLEELIANYASAYPAFSENNEEVKNLIENAICIGNNLRNITNENNKESLSRIIGISLATKLSAFQSIYDTYRRNVPEPLNSIPFWNRGVIRHINIDWDPENNTPKIDIDFGPAYHSILSYHNTVYNAITKGFGDSALQHSRGLKDIMKVLGDNNRELIEFLAIPFRSTDGKIVSQQTPLSPEDIERAFNVYEIDISSSFGIDNQLFKGVLRVMESVNGELYGSLMNLLVSPPLELQSTIMRATMAFYKARELGKTFDEAKEVAINTYKDDIDRVFSKTFLTTSQALTTAVPAMYALFRGSEAYT